MQLYVNYLLAICTQTSYSYITLAGSRNFNESVFQEIATNFILRLGNA